MIQRFVNGNPLLGNREVVTLSDHLAALEAAVREKEDLLKARDESMQYTIDSLENIHNKRIATLLAERDGYVKAHRDTEEALTDENKRMREEVKDYREALERIHARAILNNQPRIQIIADQVLIKYDIAQDALRDAAQIGEDDKS